MLKILKIDGIGPFCPANVAYNLVMKVGETQAQAQFGLKMGLLGVALVHPFFWGVQTLLGQRPKTQVRRPWWIGCGHLCAQPNQIMMTHGLTRWQRVHLAWPN